MRRVLCLVAVLFCAALLACGDEDEGPSGPTLEAGTVVGTVTDAVGRPVEGAAVVPVFGVDGIGLTGWSDPAKRGKTEFFVAIPDSGRLRLEIQDFLHATVRVLIDEVLPPGTHSAFWQADDAEDRPVPPGAYYLVASWWTDPESAPLVRQNTLMLYENEPAGLLERARVFTGPDGRYRIDLATFPVGVMLEVTDNEGNQLGPKPISHRVHFYALHEEEGSLHHADRYVVVPDREAGLQVDLQLP
jgi:hypothetical protein